MIIKANKAPPPEEDDEYWEPGMSDIYYITEEDIKKAQKEIEEGRNDKTDGTNEGIPKNVNF
jgi:hypothetical protein